MYFQLEAAYEHRVLRPLEPLALTEHQRVRLTVDESSARTWESSEAVNQRREELRWLAKESGTYAGEWAVLDGPRLVGRGEKMADVSAAAVEAGVVAGRSCTRLAFTRFYDYSSGDESIVLPVVLRFVAKQV